MRISFICNQAICFSAALLTACGTVSSTPMISRDAQVRPTTCYVYGRFLETDPTPWHLKSVFGNVVSIMVVLKDTESEKSYQIQLQEKQPVCAIEVNPGTYFVSEVVFTEHSRIFKKAPIPQGVISERIAISPGKACYIGDWQGFASSADYSGGGHNYTWELRSIQDNHAQTTKEFFAAHPKLEGLETFSVIRQNYRNPAPQDATK